MMRVQLAVAANDSPSPSEILEQGRVAAAGVALLRGRAAMVPPASAGQDNQWLVLVAGMKNVGVVWKGAVDGSVVRGRG